MQTIDYVKKFFSKEISHFSEDTQNSEYYGCNFTLNEQTYKFRIGKITPKKNGAFTVVWIKDQNLSNTPYQYENFPDFLIVFINDKNKNGYFCFPKDILKDKYILTFKNKIGKMGFRVYPPNEIDLNASATNTQEWQKNYYVEINHDTKTQE